MSPRPSWERVLAAMEAEAARAAALLEAPGAQAAIDYDEQEAPAVDVPATWRLPGAKPNASARPAFMTTPAPPRPEVEDAPEIPLQVTAPADDLSDLDLALEDTTPWELPDPAELPAPDEEMLDRLEKVHARIRALQSELSAAMTEAEAILTKPSRRATVPEPRPELVDRRM